MVALIDERLKSKVSTFEMDEHNAKRQILLQRAAEAKKRIDAQNNELNKKDALTKKTIFEQFEDRKLHALTVL